MNFVVIYEQKLVKAHIYSVLNDAKWLIIFEHLMQI